MRFQALEGVASIFHSMEKGMAHPQKERIGAVAKSLRQSAQRLLNAERLHIHPLLAGRQPLRRVAQSGSTRRLLHPTPSVFHTVENGYLQAAA